MSRQNYKNTKVSYYKNLSIISFTPNNTFVIAGIKIHKDPPTNDESNKTRIETTSTLPS